MHSLNEYHDISVQVSMKFVSKGSVDSTHNLVFIVTPNYDKKEFAYEHELNDDPDELLLVRGCVFLCGGS